MPVDLHLHTTASDGTWLPTELVRAAAGKGVTVIAVTDHDTMDGIPEATDNEGGMFSDEKLALLFKDFASHVPEKIKFSLIQSLEDYNCEDDVTFMVLKRKCETE